MSVAANLEDVLARIAAAGRRVGRDPDEVRLVAVSKTFGPERVLEALAAGARAFGENYVQEAVAKVEAVAASLPDGAPRPRWHFVGHLQRNKARDAARYFDVVETVDSERLAEALASRAAASNRRLEVLVQVNVGGEAQKSGVAPAEARRLVEAAAAMESLDLRGLMTIHPVGTVAEEARPHFAALRRLRDRLQAETGVALPELSMGMSGDFEIAVEEGATLVRVGTAIFGARAAAKGD